MSSDGCPPRARPADLGFVYVWMEVFSETYSKQCLLMRLDNKKKRNAIRSIANWLHHCAKMPLLAY